MSKAKRFLAAVVAGVVVVSLAGCAGESNEPTVMETPKIVWENGKAPSSPLEDSPYVKVLRGAEVGRALAKNTGDFTIKQLTDYVPPHSIKSIAHSYAIQGDSPTVLLGPFNPFQPLSVHEFTDGSGAAVAICEFVIGPDMEFPSSQESKPQTDYTAKIEIWEVAKVSNGILAVRNLGGDYAPPEVEATRGEPCDASQIPVGFFDPRPELPKTPVTKPVRGPLEELAPGQPSNN